MVTKSNEWTLDKEFTYDCLCLGGALLGYLRRRCSGLAEPPATQLGPFRRETLMKLTDFDLPTNYAIVHRRENQDDVGVYRAYGPDGWMKDFVTPVLAGYGCWEHHELGVAAAGVLPAGAHQ